MTKVYFTVAACLLACCSYAQKLKESEVPAGVREAFAKQFANARGVTWSKESATEYEAEFKVAGNEQSAGFDVNGKWLDTETEIAQADIPKSVRAAIEKEFAGFKIEEAEKVESPHSALLYEMQLKKDKMVYEVQFDESGKVIKKEEKKPGKNEKK